MSTIHLSHPAPHVALIEIDNPPMNALGRAPRTALLATLDRIEADTDIRCIVLTGRGKAFCSGDDLKEQAEANKAGSGAHFGEFGRVLERIETFRLPVVAAVNGHAIAGGCLVALACDVRVCTVEPKTRIGLNEVALGLQFPPGILRMIKQLVPPRWMSEVVLGAGLHGPERAKALGLVDELAEDVVTLARERLAALAKHPADAYAAAKRALRGSATVLAEDEPAFQAILPSWSSPEFKQRVAVMFTKK